VDRLTAAVALVRAAGLAAEAESRRGEVLSFTDMGLIPSSLRGYVAVAIARGLLQADGIQFNPQADFTRLDLAHALATMTK
jgi:hypothetical protein